MNLSIEELTNVFAQGFKRVVTPSGWIDQKYFSNGEYFIVLDRSSFGDILGTVYTKQGVCSYILSLNDLNLNL